MDFVDKVTSLLFSMLSRLVIAFLPRNWIFFQLHDHNHHLQWFWSPKRQSLSLFSLFPHLPWSDGKYFRIYLSWSETELLGPGMWLRSMPHLGQCAHQAPGRLNTQAWEGHKTHAQPGLCPRWVWENWGLDLESARNARPCRAPWSLSSVDLGSTGRLELGQTQCGPYTASAPHTRQRCLQCPSLPTAQLNKWASISDHLHPLCQGRN